MPDSSAHVQDLDDGPCVECAEILILKSLREIKIVETSHRKEGTKCPICKTVVKMSILPEYPTVGRQVVQLYLEAKRVADRNHDASTSDIFQQWENHEAQAKLQSAANTYVDPFIQRILVKAANKHMEGLVSRYNITRRSKIQGQPAAEIPVSKAELRQARQRLAQARKDYIRSMNLAALRAVVVEIVSKAQCSPHYGPGSPM